MDSTRPPREEEEEVDQRREADRSQREQIRSSRSRSFRPIVRGLINRSRIFLSRNRGQGGYPAPQTAPAAAPPAPPPAPPQIQPVIIHLQAPFQPPPPPAQQQRYWQPRPAYHPYQQQQQFRQPFQPRWQHSQRGFGRGHWQPPRIASGTWQPAQYYPQQQGHFEQQGHFQQGQSQRGHYHGGRFAGGNQSAHWAAPPLQRGGWSNRFHRGGRWA